MDAAGARERDLARASDPSPEKPSGTTAELSATGRVILGMLALGTETGYDIKQLVDNSTRFFWAASYGQIYPELRRLERQGLVAGRSRPSGARARTVYHLTDAGRDALDAWLGSTREPVWELRDEGMLKLFFSDAARPEQQLTIVRTMRDRQARKLAELREIEGRVTEGRVTDGPQAGPHITLQLGIAMTEGLVRAWEAAERRLTSENERE